MELCPGAGLTRLLRVWLELSALFRKGELPCVRRALMPQQADGNSSSLPVGSSEPQTSIVRLPRELTIAGILDHCRWFTLARSEHDIRQLGWRVVTPNIQPTIDAQDVQLASAEAMAVASAVAAAIPGAIFHIPNGGWKPQLRNERRLRGGAPRYLGPYFFELASEDEIAEIADKIVEDIRAIPDEYKFIGKFREVLRRFLVEALLNVFEHAYDDGEKRPVWITVSYLPRAVAESAAAGGVTSVERQWLRETPFGRLLEISVADLGRGIPRSLADAATAVVPGLEAQLKQLSSGQTQHAALRAKIHEALCRFAFEHQSTCKPPSRFRTKDHQLNWRGLYRCYRQVTELGGSVSVISGRARVGYVSAENSPIAFTQIIDAPCDVPGSIVTARLVVPAQVRSRPAVDRRLAVHRLDCPITPWDRLMGAEDRSDPVWRGSVFHAIAMPFSNLVDEVELDRAGDLFIGRVRMALEHIPPHVVPVFSLVSLQHGWTEAVRAFVPNASWRSALDGPPRLVGFWGPERPVSWIFVGAVPSDARHLLEALENQGQVTALPTDEGVVCRLFQELVSHYPDVLTRIGADSVVLGPARADFSDATIDGLVAESFRQIYASDETRATFVTDVPGSVVELTSGIFVRRYFSVYRLLYMVPLLAAAVGRQLVNVLRRRFGNARPRLMTLRPAGQVIARTLLHESGAEADVFSPDDSLATAPDANGVVVFVDALHRERTVGNVIDELRNRGHSVIGVLAVVDVRSHRMHEVIEGVPLTVLLQPEGFDAEEVADPGASSRMQTDALTNEALDYRASEFVSLGTSERREEFLKSNSNLFCVGHHFRGGRTHTFALPTRELLSTQFQRQQLAEWIAEEIRAGVTSVGLDVRESEIVIFHNAEVQIAQLLGLLVPLLDAKGAFQIVLPVAHRGSRAIYQRHGAKLLPRCRPLHEELALGVGIKARPERGFLAVYLGDSAVTGNSIREFIQSLWVSEQPKAQAAIALVVVNRLSPSEVRFFNSCDQLQKDGRALPFRYRSLFNLQIRSQAGKLSIEQPLLWSAVDDHALRVGELGAYLEALRQRAERGNAAGLRHIFHPQPNPVSLTYDAILLRQLLSLSQQNEPVSPPLATLLRKVTAPTTQDPTILVVLALEPEFMNEQPLNVFWHDLIAELAVRTLNEPAAPAELRSDALAVLASHPRALERNLGKILASVVAGGDLRWQLATHLLAGRPAGAEMQNRLRTAGYSLAGTELAPSFDRMLQVIETSLDLQRGWKHPNRAINYLETVRGLFNATFPHSHAMSQWDYLPYQLKDSRVSDSELLDAARRGVSFAEETLLPAFSALAYFAVRNVPSLAESLNTSAVIAREKLLALDRILPLDPGEGMPSREAIKQAYEELRLATWLAPFVDGALQLRNRLSDCGPLVQAVPQLFCDPLATLRSIGRARLPDVEEFKEERGNVIVVAPVPVTLWAAIADQLMENLVKHGVHSSIRIMSKTASEGYTDGTFDWTLTLFNEIAEDRSKRIGGGLHVARQYARQAQIDINVESCEEPQWGLSVTFHRCFSIHPATPLKA